jgi:multidrug efflux pump subunit AcrA (membrane-fusion protein)
MLVLSLLFTGIGLVCGFYGATRTTAVGAPAADHAAQAGPLVLGPETLKNMGVRTAPAELRSYHRSVEVAAVVAATADTRRHAYAPTSGLVEAVEAEFGAMVRAGDCVVRIVRDPLPRATLSLTRHVVEPASETVHTAMTEHRRAVVNLEILQAECSRLEEFVREDEDPVIPRARYIELKYDLRRAEQELAARRHELERHGLSAAQIKAVEKGQFPSIDVRIWRGALEHNGFWTPLAQKIHDVLPATLQARPWTVATIGEIVAGGFGGEELADWLRRRRDAAEHFLEIGGLLQRGHSLADIEARFEFGAFPPLVSVRAPSGAADWDVEALLVRPGQRVEAGQALVTLKNPRRLYLRAEPTGAEIEVVLNALRDGVGLEAQPLVPGAAPPLPDLRLRKVTYSETGRMLAYATVANEPLATRDSGSDRVFRTWRLGEGQRYLLRVPVETWKQVYVFPSTAITDDGPDKVVFLKSGDGFKPVKVEILHRDERVVVIPSTTNLFPGNPIVTHGAFPLGLALSAKRRAGSGHGHTH